jgi:hypothetical protein
MILSQHRFAECILSEFPFDGDQSPFIIVYTSDVGKVGRGLQFKKLDVLRLPDVHEVR